MCVWQTHLGVLDEGREVDDWAIQHSKQQNGNTGEDHIEGCSTDVVHQGLSTESIVELVEEQHECKGDVLVERILDEA